MLPARCRRSGTFSPVPSTETHASMRPTCARPATPPLFPPLGTSKRQQWFGRRLPRRQQIFAGRQRLAEDQRIRSWIPFRELTIKVRHAFQTLIRLLRPSGGSLNNSASSRKASRAAALTNPFGLESVCKEKAPARPPPPQRLAWTSPPRHGFRTADGRPRKSPVSDVLAGALMPLALLPQEPRCVILKDSGYFSPYPSARSMPI